METDATLETPALHEGLGTQRLEHVWLSAGEAERLLDHWTT